MLSLQNMQIVRPVALGKLPMLGCACTSQKIGEQQTRSISQKNGLKSTCMLPHNVLHRQFFTLNTELFTSTYAQGIKLLTPMSAITTTHMAKIHEAKKSQSSDTDHVVQERKSSAHIATQDMDSTVQESLQKIREKDFSDISNPDDLKHFKRTHEKAKEDDKTREKSSGIGVAGVMGMSTEQPTANMPHPIWSKEEVQSIEITHKRPEKMVDRLAWYSVKSLRFCFDLFSGYLFFKRSERIWLIRIAFLETVAGVPGMVAAMTRHLHSLRRMRRDHGWIHTLLEEAENERMHLMTALQLLKPSLAFRTAVIVAQGALVTFWSISYLISARYCHRFVGYLEEEAVITYSKLLKDIDSGPMEHWKTQPAPPLAITYWQLAPEATMKDVILAIRADEAHHRVVNHTLASMKPDDYNPYKPGE